MKHIIFYTGFILISFQGYCQINIGDFYDWLYKASGEAIPANHGNGTGLMVADENRVYKMANRNNGGFQEYRFFKQYTTWDNPASPPGNITLWDKTLISNNVLQVTDMILDRETDALYVSGYFSGNFTVNKIISPTQTQAEVSLSSSGDTEIFLLKYTASTGVLNTWKQYSSSGDTRCQSMAFGTNSSGQKCLYISGFASSTVNFPGYPAYTTSNDIYLAQLDLNLNVTNAKKVLGTDNDISTYDDTRLTADNNGNVFLACSWKERLDIEGTTPHLFILEMGAQNYRTAVFAFNQALAYQWYALLGSDASSYILPVDVKVYNGLIYVAGVFSGTTAGLTRNNSVSVAGKGQQDIFLAKLDQTQAYWIEDIGGTGNENLGEIELDSYGNIYLIGDFENYAFFDDKRPCSNGGKDVFIAKYDPSNANKWVKYFGGTSFDSGSAIDIQEGAPLEGTEPRAYIFGTVTGTIQVKDFYASNGNPLIWSLGENASNRSEFAGKIGGNYNKQDIYHPNYAYVTINASNLNPKAGESVSFTIQTVNQGSSPTYTWYINDVQVGTGASLNHVFPLQDATYNVKITMRVNSPDDACLLDPNALDTELIHTKPALCTSNFPLHTGEVFLDKGTGNIVFIPGGCGANEIALNCFGGEINPAQVERVVSSSAVVLSETWEDTNPPTDENYNPFEQGQRGKWRVLSNYTFNTSLDASDLNFEAGTYHVMPFNWRIDTRYRPKLWLSGGIVEKYSPNGDALQERNLLEIPSAVKIGYGGALPYLIAKNAEYEEILFESFENTYQKNGVTYLEDDLVLPANVSWVNTQHHSGNYSIQLSGTGALYTLKTLKLTPETRSAGALVRTWLRVADVNVSQAGIENDFKLGIATTGSTRQVNIRVVARNGEWWLCEGVVKFDRPEDLTANAYTLKIYLGPVDGSSTPAIQQIWIDDLMIQPKESEVMSYVYNPKNLRLLTSFDSQHFGLYYQYNDEGKLIRKLIETERGLKTIQETQYFTPKSFDNPND